MVNKFKKLIVLLLASVMLLSPVSVNAAKVSQGDINKIESEIASTQAEINRLKGDRDDLYKKQKEIEEQLKKLAADTASAQKRKELLDLQLEYLVSQVLATEDMIRACEEDISLKTQMIESTKKQLQEQEAVFIEFFRNNYEQGSTKLKYIEILLTSRSISDFILNVQYIGSILDYEQYLLDSTENLIITYESQITDLEEMKTLQSQNMTDLNETKETVDALSEEAIQLLEDLKKDKETALEMEEEYQQYEMDILDEIQSLVDKKNNQVLTKEDLEKQYQEQLRAEEEAKKEQNKKPVSSSGKQDIVKEGDWIWPVDYSKGKWTSPFGTRDDPFGGSSFINHHGVDLALPAGNNIYAVDDGTVIIATTHRTLGNYVVVLHDNGYRTLYAHASKLLVSVGDRVAQGKVIALVGTTGASTGNHLHFAVINLKGNYVNPVDFYPTLFSKLKKYF